MRHPDTARRHGPVIETAADSACRRAPGAARRRFGQAGALLALLCLALPCRAALSERELARVERLLQMIAGRRDLRLVRNGREHDGDTAVAFLRGKLKSQGGELNTAEEFIDRIASRSSTTGQLYWVRLPDGREITAGDFLRLELVRLDKAAGLRP